MAKRHLCTPNKMLLCELQLLIRKMVEGGGGGGGADESTNPVNSADMPNLTLWEWDFKDLSRYLSVAVSADKHCHLLLSSQLLSERTSVETHTHTHTHTHFLAPNIYSFTHTHTRTRAHCKVIDKTMPSLCSCYTCRLDIWGLEMFREGSLIFILPMIIMCEQKCFT